MITKECIMRQPQHHRVIHSNYRLREAFFQDPNVLFCLDCCQFYKHSKYQKIAFYVVSFLSFGGAYLLSLLYHGPFLIKSGINTAILLGPIILEKTVFLRWMPWQSFDYTITQKEKLVYHVNECQFCKGDRTPLDIGDSSLRSIVVNPSVLICDSCEHVLLHSRLQSCLYAVFYVSATIILAALFTFLVARSYHTILWLCLLVAGFYGQVVMHWLLRKLPWTDVNI